MGGKRDDGWPTLWADGGASGDHLAHGSLADHLGGTEQSAFVLTNRKHGLVERTEDGESEPVRPTDDGRAAMAITDERLLAVVESTATSVRSVPYTDLLSVESSKGLFTSSLTACRADGGTLRFPVRGRTDLADVTEFVGTAIEQWAAVDQRIEDARSALAATGSALRENEAEAAAEADRSARDLLAEARQYATSFRSGEHAMTRRIQQVEDRLRTTELRAHRTRAAQLVEDAERARERGAYERALSRYREAREQYEQALTVAEEHAPDEVDEVRSSLAALERAVGQLSTEPLVEVRDACEAARTAAEPAPAAWHEALTACDDLRELLARESRFEGDPDAVGMQLTWVVRNLVDAHRARAERAEAQGDRHRDGGERDAARRKYALACDHYRAARDTAREFAVGDADAVDAALGRVEAEHATLGREDGQYSAG